MVSELGIKVMAPGWAVGGHVHSVISASIGLIRVLFLELGKQRRWLRIIRTTFKMSESELSVCSGPGVSSSGISLNPHNGVAW